jgi:PTH1 family peptidyl-tRNA hydrolase
MSPVRSGPADSSIEPENASESSDSREGMAVDADDAVQGPWIIIGLGNPGEEYRNTYHNVGFRVVELLADRWGGTGWSKPGSRGMIQARIAEAEGVGSARVRTILVQPWTYMNRTGQILQPLFDRFGQNSSLLLVSDDLALPVGKIRIRERGSAGGHNGLKSVSSAYGADDYCRVRVGIETPRPRNDTIDYVLSRVSGQDRKILESSELMASEAVESVISDGVGTAMSQFNGRDLGEKP